MICPSCGGDLHPMKGQFEASEMVDVVEVSYRVIQVKQQKYACKCGGCIETALGPERATPGGRYSLDFAIKIAIDKYRSHSVGSATTHPPTSRPGHHHADALGPAARTRSKT